MIGRMAEGRFGKQIQVMLNNAPANLDYRGPLPVDEVNDLIGQSDLLLYTSLPVEGFGNSFAQAWFRGVPTISLSYELDGILEREQVGRCSRTFERLVSDVDSLMHNEPLRAEMGQRARDFAAAHLTVDRMVSNYEHLFQAVVAQHTQVEAV
jgi:glycosyltransferase involved in cell wall biosynthesis